jgi:hypothetical protein
VTVRTSPRHDPAHGATRPLLPHGGGFKSRQSPLARSHRLGQVEHRMHVSERPDLAHAGIERAALDAADDDAEIAARRERHRKISDRRCPSHNQRLPAVSGPQTSNRVAAQPVTTSRPARSALESNELPRYCTAAPHISQPRQREDKAPCNDAGSPNRSRPGSVAAPRRRNRPAHYGSVDGTPWRRAALLALEPPQRLL